MKRYPSFIDRFIYAQGECEVPEAFFRWAALSLIAACLGDRVYCRKFRGSRLLPNLYVILIGPSGLGKGVAIDAVMKLAAEDVPWTKPIRTYRGKVTGPHLVDWLSAQSRENEEKAKLQGDPMPEPGRMYLVTPELSMSVGGGPMADVFVKLMTELYTGGDYTFHEGTRTSGKRKVRSPVINWLAGSTREWLVNSVDKDAITGGFFGRVASVSADYNFSRRVFYPVYPSDHAEVTRFLQRRLRWMCKVAGEVSMSAKAREVEEHWYMNRPVPDDEAMLPTWKREHDMLIKLSMCLMVDERCEDLVIRDRHVVKAQQLLHHVQSAVPELITLASVTPESDGLRYLERVMKQVGAADEALIAYHAAARGITYKRAMEIMDTLERAGIVDLTEGHFTLHQRTLLRTDSDPASPPRDGTPSRRSSRRSRSPAPSEPAVSPADRPSRSRARSRTRPSSC